MNTFRALRALAVAKRFDPFAVARRFLGWRAGKVRVWDKHGEIRR